MTRALIILLCALVFFSFGATGKPGQIHFVGPLQADVKEAASASSRTKLVIAMGRKVVEFDRKGNWCLVGIDRTGGKDGWVHCGNLDPTDSDGLTY